MVTPDEQRALQLENAKADLTLWSGLRDVDASTISNRENLIAAASTQLAEAKERVAAADESAKTVQARIEAIERGETVQGGFGKPIDVAAFLKSIGWTNANIRHAQLLGRYLPEEHLHELVAETMRLASQGQRRRATQALR